MSLENKSHYIGNELNLFSHATCWKQYWSNKLEPLMGESVLEVGAGIGSNLGLLCRRHQQWIALEPDEEQALIIQRKLSEQKSLNNVDVICGDLNTIKPEEKFDTILYIDVLEHIEDDEAELEYAMRCLKSGGRLIVLAPAHQKLFSSFDQEVGHYRRYDKAMLNQLTVSGSHIEELIYIDSVGFFASLLNKKILKSNLPTKNQIWFWDKVMVPMSRIVDVIIGFRFGKTIIAVWQKE